MMQCLRVSVQSPVDGPSPPSSQSSGAEHVIKFNRSPGYRCRVIVIVPSGVTLEDVEAIFSRLSLLHQVQLIREDNNQDWVCVVAYYAPVFARQASQIFHGMDVKKQGHKLKVYQMGYRKGSAVHNNINYPLTSRDCVLVLNHFLGFDGWSSRLRSIDFKTKCIATVKPPKYECCCVATVELRIRDRTVNSRQQIVVEGHAKVEPSQVFPSLGAAIQQAQKRAVTEGRKAALANNLELVVRYVAVKKHCPTPFNFVLDTTLLMLRSIHRQRENHCEPEVFARVSRTHWEWVYNNCLVIRP